MRGVLITRRRAAQDVRGKRPGLPSVSHTHRLRVVVLIDLCEMFHQINAADIHVCGEAVARRKACEKLHSFSRCCLHT